MNWRDEQESLGIKLAVIGDPVAHSLSPKMQSAAIATLSPHPSAGEGFATYKALQVTKEDFPTCISHLKDCGYLGINITIPHKQAAAQLAQHDDAIVPATNAANVIKFGERTLCRNTDAAGFIAPINHLTPNTALILGAGAASTTAVYALLKNGWQVKIWNRTQERANKLKQRFPQIEIASEPNPHHCSLVVNATPIGIEPLSIPDGEGQGRGKLPLLNWENLNATVYDMAYKVEPTDFLIKARELGNPIIDGREMLVEQGALSFEWWFNSKAPREIMRKAVGL